MISFLISLLENNPFAASCKGGGGIIIIAIIILIIIAAAANDANLARRKRRWEERTTAARRDRAHLHHLDDAIRRILAEKVPGLGKKPDAVASNLL